MASSSLLTEDQNILCQIISDDLLSLPVAAGMYGGRPSQGFTIDVQGNLYSLYSAMRWSLIRVDPSGNSREIASGGSVPSVKGGLARDTQGNLAMGWSIEAADMSGLNLVPQSADGSYDLSAGTSMSLEHQGIEDMVYDAAGNLYILDARYQLGSADQSGANATTLSEIRVISRAPDGTVATLYSGLPTATTTTTNRQTGYHRMGIAVAADGTVYFSDSSDHAIYRLGSDGQPALVAGKSGEAGSSD
jgi:sugar lactone lactonase YvrE